MTPLEIYLKERNEELMEELQKASYRIGALEYDLRKLRQQVQSCWRPVQLPDRGAKVWIREGGAQ